MNARVREMVKDAIESTGVEEIFKLGNETSTDRVPAGSQSHFKRVALLF